MANRTNRSRGAYRIAIGVGLLMCSGLLLVRAAGPWPGDAVVWPATVALIGALLIWRAPAAAPAGSAVGPRTTEPPSARQPSLQFALSVGPS